MKLLIITQKVDQNDPILGFFHRWIIEFSKQCEKVTVICLQKGKYDLPTSVRVLSLGKENGVSKIKYLWNFYRYIWQERKNYDSVFVHMNQEYVILGWKFWKLWGKKIWLWRNHPSGSILTKIAVLVSNRVFCTSKQSYTAQFKKTEIMPVGIDTDFFKRNELIKKEPNSILFLGRISPIKKPEILIEALGLLKKENINFTVSIVGDPLPKDRVFYESLIIRVSELDLNDRVKFLPAITNNQTLELYNRHEIFVNLTPSGSLDKTIFEAISSGSIFVVFNQSLIDLKGLNPFFVCQEGSLISLVASLKYFLTLSDEDKKGLNLSLRTYACKHSLEETVTRIVKKL